VTEPLSPEGTECPGCEICDLAIELGEERARVAELEAALAQAKALVTELSEWIPFEADEVHGRIEAFLAASTRESESVEGEQT
jgi:hypothetical protein